MPTPEQINEMEAGPELDALAAQIVMKWNRLKPHPHEFSREWWCRGEYDPNDETTLAIPVEDWLPSRNISDAMELCEHLACRENDFQCILQLTFTSYRKATFRGGGIVVEHECESLPLAITRAAIIAALKDKPLCGH